MSKKRKNYTVIYNDYDGYTYDDAKQNLKEMHLEDYPDDKDWEPTDEEIQSEINISDEVIWDDTKYELEKLFNNGDTYILCGYAGLWNGNARGGFIFDNFNEFSRVFNNVDYVKIYDQGGKFYIDGYHHDGTNHWHVKRLTEKGLKYYDRHCEDNIINLHQRLFDTRSGYSVNLKYAKNILGV